MFYGVVNRLTGDVVCANAGQFPFPVRFGEAAASWIGGKSPPVGMFPDSGYQEEHHTLAAGGGIAMVSDGLLELMADQTLEARKQRLLDAVAAAPTTAEELATTLGMRDDIALPDDASILLMRRTEHDG